MKCSRASLIVVAVDERCYCFENRGNYLMQQYFIVELSVCIVMMRGTINSKLQYL